jgi:DNA-binding GntR family transcriptional regulator
MPEGASVRDLLLAAALRRGEEPVSFQTKADLVHDALRRAIIQGDLPPGKRIDQEEVAAALDVSRMPLRQALARLEADGFIEARPHRSAIVSALSREHVEELYGMRIALESMLAERATAHIADDAVAELDTLLERQRGVIAEGAHTEFVTLDRRFHRTLYAAAGWTRALKVVEQLRDASDRYVHVYVRGPDNARRSLREHAALATAVRRRDGGEAGRVTAAHIRAGLDRLAGLLAASSIPPTSKE